MAKEERERLGIDGPGYMDDGSILEDTVTGAAWHDTWEPEDASFIRALNWVPCKLNALADEVKTLQAKLDIETGRRIEAEHACWVGMMELKPWDGCGERPCPEEAFKAMQKPANAYYKERFGK